MCKQKLRPEGKVNPKKTLASKPSLPVLLKQRTKNCTISSQALTSGTSKMADFNGVNDGPSKVKTKACRFFQTKRGCKFGYECQFLHSAKTSSKSGNVVSEGDEFVSDNEVKNFEPDISLNDDSEQCNERLGEDKEVKKHEDSSQDRRDIACKFFQRKRGCMRGSKCPFVHVLVDEQSAQTNKSASDENVKSTRSRKENTSKRKKLTRPSSDKEQDESKLTKSSCLQLEKGDQKPKEQGYLPVQKANADTTIASQGSEVTMLNSNKSVKCEETKTEGMHGIKCNTAGVNTSADCNKVVKGRGNNVGNHVKSRRQPGFFEKGKGMESKENNMRGSFNETNRAVPPTKSTTGIPTLQQDASVKGSVTEHGGSTLKNRHEGKHEQCEKGLPLSQKNSAMSGAVTRKRSPLPNKENERTRDRNQTHNKDNCASNFRGSYTLADAMLNEPKKLRATEIQQLKRRFGGKGGFLEMKENSSYRIKFKPTDPDWVSSIINDLLCNPKAFKGGKSGVNPGISGEGLYTCQLSCIRHQSHACGLKTSISRINLGQFLMPDSQIQTN